MTEPRCAGATIHFMDELVLMEKMMEEMFAMDDVEQVEELDIKKGNLLISYKILVQTVRGSWYSLSVFILSRRLQILNIM